MLPPARRAGKQLVWKVLALKRAYVLQAAHGTRSQQPHRQLAHSSSSSSVLLHVPSTEISNAPAVCWRSASMLQEPGRQQQGLWVPADRLASNHARHQRRL